MDVKADTHRGWDICWMSRPRLIETKKFLGCRDRDSSRLRNFLDVETKTHWDREIPGMSKPRLETGKFDGCWDRDHSRVGKKCRDQDQDSSWSFGLLKLIFSSCKNIPAPFHPNWPRLAPVAIFSRILGLFSSPNRPQAYFLTPPLPPAFVLYTSLGGDHP